MGNLADHRRLREAKGLYKEDPGKGKYTKQEAKDSITRNFKL